MPSFTRRTFLAAVPAFAQPPARKISIAFLGAAHSHAEGKIAVVRANPAFSLVGIVEDDPKFRARYETAGLPMITRDRALSDPSIEVIAVESEVKRHAKDGFAALNAGKHVHLEKPPADNMAETRVVIDTARRKQRLLQLGYMWRHHEGMNRMLDAARQGWLGDIYLIKGMMNTLITAEQRPEWNLFPGGQMFEQGCHLFDPIVRLLGRPAKISSVLKTSGNFQDTLKDNTVAVLEYPRAIAMITTAVLQPGAGPYRCLEIYGTNGTAVLRPIEQPVLEIDLAKPAGPYKAGRQRIDLAPFQRYVGDFSELARCVVERRPLSVTLDQELVLQQVLLEASHM
ncbi:Gfo/Idh/MocA family oxidoreductase [uncultured Paludibaculum sp.]|uniref:Gfo/Idh/MocA family protein n=1 Tax=uncultured Paludibaculum sp. TaxID=1765020 RepID=UPI002AAC2C11|nr:Gfo/Idh/MocA family oxidoreductase [uncultured Paludibaculum sp.]